MKFCTKCGTQLNDEDGWCTNCGSPAPQIQQPQSQQTEEKNGAINDEIENPQSAPIECQIVTTNLASTLKNLWSNHKWVIIIVAAIFFLLFTFILCSIFPNLNFLGEMIYVIYAVCLLCFVLGGLPLLIWNRIEKTNKKKKNSTATALHVIGILTIILGIIGSFIIGAIFPSTTYDYSAWGGYDIDEAYNWSLVIEGILTSCVTGICFIGFGEIIKLLQIIANRQNKILKVIENPPTDDEA